MISGTVAPPAFGTPDVSLPKSVQRSFYFIASGVSSLTGYPPDDKIRCLKCCRTTLCKRMWSHGSGIEIAAMRTLAGSGIFRDRTSRVM